METNVDNLIRRYNEDRDKAISMKSKIEQLRYNYQEILSQYNAQFTSLHDLRDSTALLQASVDTFKEIIDRLSQQNLEQISAILTYALQTIFYDCNYSIEIAVVDKRNNKTAELYLVEKRENEPVLRSDFDSIGGGIKAVVGLVLQIYYISKLNLSPIVFMDEALSQVSSDYVPTMMQFIKELSESKKFIVVLISHDERYIKYADTIYKVSDGKVTNGSISEV